MIHPTAIVSPHAHLGSGVIVGPYSIVYDNVDIGDNCDIGSHCEIGYPSVNVNGRPLVIGSGSRVRSHSVLYEGSTLGEGLVTGHRVTVREGTQAGINLQIGTLGDIQGECRIGNHVRFHSGVFVCQKSIIADFVWLFPHVVLTEDPHPPSETRLGVTLDEYAAVAAGSVILPGVRIGRGALVGAMSSVSRDVAPGTVVAGAPARVIGRAADIKLRDGSGQPAYPWRRHFHRGYPDAVVERWLNEFGLDKTPPNEHQA